MKGVAIFGGIAFVIALVVGLNCFKVVDPGHMGVYVLFGNASEQELPEGLHWVNPFSKVVEVSVQQKKYEVIGTDASSKDLQNVTTSIAVNYNALPSEASRLYTGLSGDNKVWEQVVINPAVEETLKEVTAKYTAEEIIHKRAEAKSKITESITVRLLSEGINVINVSITDFRFNSNFNDAIEAKQIAEQQAKQAEHDLRKKTVEAKRKVVEAEADKKARIAQAEGKAREIELLAEAEKSYHDKINQSVTTQSLLMRAIEKWDGNLPKVMSEGMEMILPSDNLK